MTTRTERILEMLAELNPEALLLDGFEPCLIGIAERCGQPALAVYDLNQMLDLLLTRDDMDPDEALEYLEFNTLGAWFGPHTPVVLRRDDTEIDAE